MSLLILVGCKKDDDTETSQTVTGNSISFGNSEASQVTKEEYDPPKTISSTESGGEVRDTIGFNFTGGKDIVFISYGNHWANTKSSSIMSINSNLEFLVIETNDTIYKTNTSVFPNILDSNIVWNSLSGFTPLTPYYSVVQIRVENLVYPYEESTYVDPANAEGTWSQIGTFSSYSNGYTYLPDPTDNIYYFNYRKLGLWNQVEPEPRYVLFRYRQNSSYSYGWIKMDITNYYKITVYELAY